MKRRSAAVRAAGITMLWVLWATAAQTADMPQRDVEAQPAVAALAALRHAWLEQLDQLTGMARSLAAARDTYEFVVSPNIPYVDAHYAREDLASEGIDTVLIVNRSGKPLFWRRINHGQSRGFSDARAFLAELPRLSSFSGVATLAEGPILVAAVPINEATGSGEARGWLILAQAFDGIQVHPIEATAQVPVQMLDPAVSTPGTDIDAALREPLTPFVTLDATHIRGVMAVMDVRGNPFRVFGVSLPRQTSGQVSPGESGSSNRRSLIAAAFIVGSGAFVVLLNFRNRRRQSASGPLRATASSTPLLPVQVNDSAQPDIDVTPLHARAVPVAQEGTGFIALQTRERLQARLAAMHAVFLYQPQIDLQTGRVAGIEALICSSKPGKDRPSSELVAEIEASGLGLALLEHWLQKACRDQHFWLGEVGHDFPLGFPVSQRTLLSRGFLPLVQRILLETRLPPEFLELEISEAAFGTSATTLRALRTISEAGISIAIDKFSGTKASLCLLTLVPIAKLRIDPSLLRNIGGASPEALLFDGIIGAARGLGMTVCVTGVASEDSLAAILRHARPLAQGMAIGAPLNTEDFIQLLHGSCADTATLQPLVVVV